MTQLTLSTQEKTAIYVADLADYSSGILRGQWIEIGKNTTLEDLKRGIKEMLDKKGHEGYAIHDYNNLPSSCLGEYPDLGQVIEVAKAVHEHGFKLVEGYLEYFGLECLSDLEDRFRGVYSSTTDYAHELINECYNLDKMLGELASYVDYESCAQRMISNGEIVTVQVSSNEVAIFISH